MGKDKRTGNQSTGGLGIACEGMTDGLDGEGDASSHMMGREVGAGVVAAVKWEGQNSGLLSLLQYVEN